MPYLYFYLHVLESSSNINEYHLLYWQRDTSLDVAVPSVFSIIYKYSGVISKRNKLLLKIPHFLSFREKARRIIKSNHYDKVVFLHSTPGLLLYKILRKNKTPYLLDYRDFSHENIGFYKKSIESLTLKSELTLISSPGFRVYLPKTNKIYNVHNLSEIDFLSKPSNEKIRMSCSPFIIRYWGIIRHSEINLTLIGKIANDSRFELHYHGREQEEAIILKHYCSIKGVKNVYFHGEYLPQEREKFAANTHMIHNLYDNRHRALNALGNKFYDGILFHLPQLCAEGSYMGEQVAKLDLGLVIDLNNGNVADIIYDFLKKLDYQKFDARCVSALNEIKDEQRDARELLKQFLMIN